MCVFIYSNYCWKFSFTVKEFTANTYMNMELSLCLYTCVQIEYFQLDRIQLDQSVMGKLVFFHRIFLKVCGILLCFLCNRLQDRYVYERSLVVFCLTIVTFIIRYGDGHAREKTVRKSLKTSMSSRRWNLYDSHGLYFD